MAMKEVMQLTDMATTVESHVSEWSFCDGLNGKSGDKV